MTRFFSTLRFRLLLLVILALLPAMGLIVYSTFEHRNLMAQDADDDVLRLARIASSSQAKLFDSVHELLAVLALLPAVRDREPAVCNAFLANLIKEYPRYSQFGVTNLDGSVVCASNSAQSHIAIASTPLFQRVLETETFAIGDYGTDAVSGRAYFTFGHPIFGEHGQVQGLVFAALDLASLNELVAQIQLPLGSSVTLRDQRGMILARYPDPEKWVGKAFPDAPIAKIILSRREGTAESIGIDNVYRLYGFTTLRGVSDNAVYVSVGLPPSVAFANLNGGLIRNLVALVLVLALVLGLAWFGADWMLLRRVNALLRVTNRLAEGDLSARTDPSYGVGELDQLERSFDQMAETLELREIERKAAEASVFRWSARLEGLISAVAEVLGQPRDVNKMMEVALSRILTVLDLPAGCIFSKQGEDLVLVTQIGLGDEIKHRVQGFENDQAGTREIARLVQSGSVEETTPDALQVMRVSTAGTFKSWISVPIKSKAHVFGILFLAADHQSLERQEQDALAAVGQELGVAIENAELYDQVQSIAVLKERERLSRELHDGLAQVLGYLRIRCKTISDLVASPGNERAWEQLQEMQRTIHEAYQDIRESILGLRTTVSPNKDVVSAIKEYAHTFGTQTGIRISLSNSGDDHFVWTPEAEVQLLRIIQEALSNVRKHSRAKQAWIRFDLQPRVAIVTIEDNGKGFDIESMRQDNQQHFGLQTMRERAEGVGGSVQVESRLGQGTKIKVTLATSGEGR